MTHAALSESLIRPPGCPPSTCPGELCRVDGSGGRIADDAAPFYDDAQNGEGEPGEPIPLALWRCSRCRSTLAVSTDKHGNRRARNDWSKPEPLTATA